MGRSSVVTSCVVFGSLLLGGAACTSADGALLILQNQEAAEQCLVTADLGAFVSRGRIDTNAEEGYSFNPLVQNSASTETNNDGETLNRVAIIEGAEVKLTLQEGLFDTNDRMTALTNFTARFSGAIQPDGAFSAFTFTVIPKDLLDLMAPALAGGAITEVKVETTIFGTISGGGVESNKFVFWVDVCTGCMKVDQGDCTALSADFVGETGGVCQELQDTKIDCCTGSDGAEVCPAVPEALPATP